MRIFYIYDVTGIEEKKNRFFLEFNSEKITSIELKELLLKDGAALNDSTELMYFNNSVNSFCTFPFSEPLEEPNELIIQIKKGFSLQADSILSQLEQLENTCQETEFKFEETLHKTKLLSKHRENNSRVPCKELDIVMLHASPLMHLSKAFESCSLNFSQEKEVLVNRINRSASVRFEIATPENLKELFEYHSRIVIISCESFLNDSGELALAVEKFEDHSEIGEMFELTLTDMKKLLAWNRFNQIIIVKSKNFEEVGQFFLDVGFSIILAVKDNDSNSDAMVFIADVVDSLLAGNTIEDIDEHISNSINENQPKYRLFFTEESMKEQKFFVNGKKGTLDIVSDTYSQYKPPLTQKLTVGRRKEIRDLVSAIFKNKCINVTGPCGVGKTMLLKRTAQYLYERRVFKDGVVYLDICMRTDMIFLYRYLASIMKFPLSDQLSIADDEKILSMINNTEVLLIIDNIDRLDNKERIKSDIAKVISGTDKPKFIIGSQSVFEIEDIFNYELMQLTQEQAKTLLHVNGHKNSDLLDEIVGKVGKNPADLLHFSPLLKKNPAGLLSEFAGSKYFSMETSISYVLKHFPNFLTFLKLMSYMPSGACLLNTKALCSELIKDYTSILEYLRIEDKVYWFIHSDDKFEFILLRSHVMDYLTFVVPHDPVLAKTALVHLGVYARAVLKKLLKANHPASNQYRGSLLFINAGIDHGIWGAGFEEPSRKMLEELDKSRRDPEKMFERIESNFWYYLNCDLIKDMLKLQHNALDETSAKALGEIILCTTSVFILLGKTEDAMIMILRGRELCSTFNLERINALLLLTKASLYPTKKHDKKYLKAKGLAEKAKKYFLNREEAGLAECSFLLALINFKTKKVSNSCLSLKKTSSNLVEEDAEMDLVINRFKSARQELGCARAQLSYSKYMLKKLSDVKINDYLREAIKVFNDLKFFFWKTKAQICLFKWYFKGSNWVEARRILNDIDESQRELNSLRIEKYLGKVNERIKKNYKHAISFFYASPSDNQIEGSLLRSMNRTNEAFVDRVHSSLESLSKKFCLRYEVLNRANFKSFLEDKPMILHISSNGFVNTHLIFQSDILETDLVDFHQFSLLCEGSLRKFGVELLVLAIPLSKKFAKDCQQNLHIRHVVGFELLDFNNNKTCPEQVASTLEASISSFCIEFYTQLLKGKPVKESFVLAKRKMNETVQAAMGKLKDLVVKGVKFWEYWESVKESEPELMNSESDEDDCYLLSTDIPPGELIIMSSPNSPLKSK